MEHTRPDETEQTVRERLATRDEDVKTAIDPRKVIAEIQRKLRQPQPR